MTVRNYTDSLAEISASFPGATFTPWEFKDVDLNGIEVEDEAITVPSASPYIVALGHQIQDQSTLVVKDAALNSFVKKGFDETISASEVGVDAKRGLLKFAAANATDSVTASYTHVGSVYLSDFANRIQKELVALEENVVQTISSTDNAIARFDGTGGQLQDSGVTVSDLGVLDAVAGVNHASQLDLSIANTAIATLTASLFSLTTPLDVTGGGTFSGNLGAVDGSFSGDIDAVNAVFSGNVGAVDGSFSGDIDAVNIDAFGYVAGDSIRIGANVVIDDARETYFVTGEYSGALVVGSLSSGGGVSGTTGTFTGDLTTTAEVGAGTASPSAKLHVTAGGTLPALGGSTLAIFQDTSASNSVAGISILAGEGSNGAAFIAFGEKYDENNGQITYDNSSDQFRFRTAGSATCLTLDSSGLATFAGARITVGGIPWITGTGDPESAVTAPVGALYSRTDGGASTTLYVKESGTGNTGWAAK